MEAPVEDRPTSSWLIRHDFLIRRLHSLSGLVPVGAFLLLHLSTNASVLAGPEMFQANVDRIHSLGPLLPLVEWLFIFLPILFHAVIGFVIIAGGLPNTSSYPYAANVRYTLQRVTGVIAFVYIAAHVAHMHQLGQPLARVSPGMFARFDPHAATSTAAAAIQASLLVQIAYGVGTLASVYHLANGIWTMGITWGVWTSPGGQRRAGRICVAFGLLLAIVGMGGLWGMVQADIDRAVEVEKRLE